jgi:outer membrane protein
MARMDLISFERALCVTGHAFRRRAAIVLWFAAMATSAPDALHAETLNSALAKAYSSNPGLNQQRATVEGRDEEVAKAAGGMRPRLSASVNGGAQFNRLREPAGRNSLGKRAYSTDQSTGEPRAASFGLSQPLFDGWRTDNSVRQAEAGVHAAQATTRQGEQETLLNAVTAYMNVLRDTAVLSLRKNNIAVLKEQLRATREREGLGDQSPTDVAQAEAALAHARMEFDAARTALESSAANFRQVIGEEPRHLEPAPAVESPLPASIDEAIRIALAEHPSVEAATHQIAAAEYAVKVSEGALLPTLSANVQVNQQYESFFGIPGTRQFTAQASGTLNVPIYQGGVEYASIRLAKAQLREARFAADVQRDTARANVISSFGQLRTALASISTGHVAVRAAATALKGVRDEAQFGQRTTLDVLNAQQALLNARVDLVSAQRDRVVASYTALGALGRLSAERLRLGVELFDPAPHLEAARAKWFGLDGPDAR